MIMKCQQNCSLWYHHVVCDWETKEVHRQAKRAYLDSVYAPLKTDFVSCFVAGTSLNKVQGLTAEFPWINICTFPLAEKG